MANIKVIEKNEGEKIAYRQSDSCLYFGDDELMLNVAKYQKDWPIAIDICKDRVGNLTIGTGSAQYYVAQIQIPAATYSETTTEGEGEEIIVTRELNPINMGKVELALWSIE